MIKFAKKDLNGCTPYDLGRSDFVEGQHTNPWPPYSWAGRQWGAGQDWEMADLQDFRQEYK